MSKNSNKTSLFGKKKNAYGYAYGYGEKRNKDDLNACKMLCENMHFSAREAYRLLRTNVLFTLPSDGGCKVIGITSATRGEGKSTTSINLAYTIAQNGNKVLLIDGDMRLPSIGAKLNMKAKYGLSDLIIGNISSKDVLYHYGNNDRFHILFSGSIPPNPNELLGSVRMGNIIKSLSENYDYIILDLPPVNIVSDALVTRNIADGLIVVVREGYSNKRALAECLSSLDFLKINVLGIVLADSASGPSYYNGGRYKYRGYYKSSYRYGRHYGYGGHRYGYGEHHKGREE